MTEASGKSWQQLDVETQKEEYEKQSIVQEIVGVIQEWACVYARLARAMADAFGEEEVLDTLEQTWWEQQYEAGKTWRDEFDADPVAAFAAMERRWRHDPNALGAYFGTIVHPVTPADDPHRWELVTYSCYHDIFRKIGERKIGMSWCMSDLAAVRGWSPQVVMDFPHVLLRGASYCHQTRLLVDDADPALDQWSKEVSEKFGWRSIKKLEEGER